MATDPISVFLWMVALIVQRYPIPPADRLGDFVWRYLDDVCPERRMLEET